LEGISLLQKSSTAIANIKKQERELVEDILKNYLSFTIIALLSYIATLDPTKFNSAGISTPNTVQFKTNPSY